MSPLQPRIIGSGNKMSVLTEVGDASFFYETKQDGRVEIKDVVPEHLQGLFEILASHNIKFLADPSKKNDAVFWKITLYF